MISISAFFFKIIHIDFFAIAFLFHCISLIIYPLYFFLKIQFLNCLSKILFIFSILFYFLSFFQFPLLERSFFQLYNLYETLVFVIVFFSLLIMILYFFYIKKDFFIYCGNLFLLLFSFIGIHFQKNYSLFLPLSLTKTWIFIPHIFSYFIGYTFIFLSFIIVIYSKVLEKFYFKKQSYFPIIHFCMKISFIFLTIGISFGTLWSNKIWGDFWIWGPKENWALASWILYVIYFHLVFLKISINQIYNFIFLVCFSVLFTYLGISFLPKEILNFSLHNYTEI